MTETTTINSWEDFSSFIHEFSRTSAIYRGVVKSEYELVPKIGRPEARRKGPYDEEHEKSFFWRFVTDAVQYMDKQPQSTLDWMVIAQHHGLPTRLLDWSLSPLVAAYFAAIRGGVDAPDGAAIYMLPIPRKVPTDILDPFTVSDVAVFGPRRTNQRITSQRSMMTIHPKPNEPYRPDSLVKAVIAQKYCAHLKADMMNWGIRHQTLFPGLDGLCADIAWEMQWHF